MSLSMFLSFSPVFQEAHSFCANLPQCTGNWEGMWCKFCSNSDRRACCQRQWYDLNASPFTEEGPASKTRLRQRPIPVLARVFVSPVDDCPIMKNVRIFYRALPKQSKDTRHNIMSRWDKQIPELWICLHSRKARGLQAGCPVKSQ